MLVRDCRLRTCIGEIKTPPVTARTIHNRRNREIIEGPPESLASKARQSNTIIKRLFGHNHRNAHGKRHVPRAFFIGIQLPANSAHLARILRPE